MCYCKKYAPCVGNKGTMGYRARSSQTEKTYVKAYGLDEAIPKKEERLEKLKSSADNVNAFIEKAKKYKSIDVLTPEFNEIHLSKIVPMNKKTRSSSIFCSFCRPFPFFDKKMQKKLLFLFIGTKSEHWAKFDTV